MAIGNLVPWRWGSLRNFDEDRSFGDLRAEMDSLRERAYGSFRRTIDLPKTKEAQERVKQIPVKAA